MYFEMLKLKLTCLEILALSPRPVLSVLTNTILTAGFSVEVVEWDANASSVCNTCIHNEKQSVKLLTYF